MPEAIAKIAELITQEAHTRQGPDFVSCLYAVLIEVDLAVGKAMADFRAQEREAGNEQNTAFSPNYRAGRSD